MTTAEILQQYGLHLPDTSPGQHYTTCPECSAKRSLAHQGTKCLGVKIDEKGACWRCNHCGWSGPEKDRGNGKAAAPIEATYDYIEGGEFRFQKVRYPQGHEPRFLLRTRDSNGGWKWGAKDVPKPLYRIDEIMEAIASGHTILIAEGEKDVDNLWRIGLPATSNFDGTSDVIKNPNAKPKWKAAYSETLRGADIVILNDNDPPGYAHADTIARMSVGICKRVRRLDLAPHWPDMPPGKDVSDWLALGHTREELDALIERAPDYAADGSMRDDIDGERVDDAPEQAAGSKRDDMNAPPPLIPCTIEQTLEVFEHWLILPDRTPVYAVLGTVAANLLPGDPVWLGLIAPPSSAKTEILNSISKLPRVVQAATLSPAGLLSGTPQKQRATGTKGGLLRQLGDFGIISLKDFGSILSMRPDAKAEVLAALREIYDGAWTRHLGSDGGRTLAWQGKVALIFGATGVIDSHYAVIGAMGDRFLLNRLAPGNGQFARALQHAGAATGQMRKELAQAVSRLFVSPLSKPRPLGDEEFARLDRAVTLVVRLRGAVERDRNSREIEAIYGAEGTARIGLTLERLLAGLDTLGVDRAIALDVVEQVAMDSVPPLRRRAYEYLISLPPDLTGIAKAETSAVAKALGLPTVTVRRALEDLAAYGLVERVSHGSGKADLWKAHPWEGES
jgi:hypothetical protein